MTEPETETAVVQPAPARRSIWREDTNIEDVRRAFGPIVAGLIGDLFKFSAVLPQTPGENLSRVAEYAIDLYERFAPRDPVEEMFAVQIITAHFRALSMSERAALARGGSPKWNAIILQAADSASNTFRRLALGLAEYREPKRSATFIKAQNNTQLNGEQQVVMIGDGHEKPNSKKQIAERTRKQKSLPAVHAGAEIPSIKRSEGEAVAVVNRSKNARGKGTLEHERPSPRDEKRRDAGDDARVTKATVRGQASRRER